MAKLLHKCVSGVMSWLAAKFLAGYDANYYYALRNSLVRPIISASQLCLCAWPGGLGRTSMS